MVPGPKVYVPVEVHEGNGWAEVAAGWAEVDDWAEVAAGWLSDARAVRVRGTARAVMAAMPRARPAAVVLFMTFRPIVRLAGSCGSFVRSSVRG
jgi:hypothetical protein